MKISVRGADPVRIVDVEGDVDLGTSPDLRRTLFDALRAGPKVLLNLAAIRYIDSSGIATLIEVLKASQRDNKLFVLYGLSPAVEQVFRLTHVIRIFRVCATEQEAIDATMGAV
jgi:anti-sigma B factor antagonist